MPKKIMFEQVSLQVVKKVLEEQIKREELTESDPGIKRAKLKRLEQLLSVDDAPNGNGRKA
jgi:hypothetical protein